MSLARFFRRGRWDDERAREIQAHLAIETDEQVARGMTPDEAWLAARRKLGNATLVREDIYQMNTINLLDSLWRDLKHGVRLLRLNPAFAAVAILSLALGVGANTAIFQLLDAVRLRTLPVQDPQQLAEVRIITPKGGRTGHFTSSRPMLTYQQWELVRDRQEAFSSTFVWSEHGFNLSSGGEARMAQGLWVSGEFFDTLGVPAAIGRTLVAGDDRRGCATPPAVLSYAFWQREFGGEPSAIGHSLTLDGHAFDIVGVAPASFFGVNVGARFDVAVPLCAEPLSRGASSGLVRPATWFLAMFGRLKPGWTIERANAQLAAVSPPIFSETLPTEEYRAEDAQNYLKFTLSAYAADTGVSSLRRNYESPLWLLLATTGLVLLIACANLANLMLARATAREREVAVRLAIGASRGRVVRQLLAESLLLAAVGAAGGALLAQWLSRFLVDFLATDGNHLFVDLALDWRVFGFTAALAVTTCVLFGLMPALRATSVSPGAAMKAGSRGSTDTGERFGLRRLLVVAQVALSLVLVVGALLFARTLRNLMTLDAGFRQDGLLAVDLDLRRAGVPAGRRVAFAQDLTDRLAALPGVTSAAQALNLPASSNFWNDNITINGAPVPGNVNLNQVSPGYFRTMGTPILRGRDFDLRLDTASSERVAIVTEAFARKYFAGADPIGRMFQRVVTPGAQPPLVQIVGVVTDMKYEDLREPFGPIAFFPAAQTARGDDDMQVVLRASAPLTTITAEVAGAISAIDKSIAIEFSTVERHVRESLLRERLMATLSGFFGVLAALIAMIGLYGVMSYMVARRRNEIGIRIALGADRGDVMRLMLREAGVLLAVGVVAGLVMAVAAGRVVTTMLFGLSATDPATLAAAAAGLGVVAMLASYLPALRASRLEPTEALREE